MLAITIQGLAALVLAGATVSYRRRPDRLVPFLVFAAATGLLCTWRTASEVFVASYSGAQPGPEATPPFGLSLEQYALAESLLVLLPTLGFIPAVRRQSPVLTVLAVAACLPAVIAWVG